MARIVAMALLCARGPHTSMCTRLGCRTRRRAAKPTRRLGACLAALIHVRARDLCRCVEPANEAAVQLYEGRGFEMVAGEPEREGMRLMLRK